MEIRIKLKSDSANSDTYAANYVSVMDLPSSKEKLLILELSDPSRRIVISANELKRAMRALDESGAEVE